MRFRKKPVVIEAVQWTGDNLSELRKMDGFDRVCLLCRGELMIHTLEGICYASVGDYIIMGVNGEFYPCKPDIFAKTYEPEEGKMMYDKLVKDLREKAEFLAAAEPLSIKNAFAETMKQAAIAIEELSMTADSYKRNMEAWANEAVKAWTKLAPLPEPPKTKR